ncbi:MAG TPA: hypothetical protein VM597_05920 [Gemmataceae bacterium]|nr:hypothetical protein [Gemmataceae bacterium]
MGLDYKFITRTGSVRSDAGGPAPGGLDPPPHLIELMPEAVARGHLVLPLALEGDVLTVAAVNPDDLLLRDKLSFILNKNVRLVAAPEADLVAAINKHYSQPPIASVDSYLMEAPAPRARGRLTGFGRSLGKTVTEFKRGVKSFEDDADESISDLAAVLETPGLLPPGQDPTSPVRKPGMFHYTVEEGQRVLVVDRFGHMDVVAGPKRVPRWRKRFRPMKHFVAHPGEFLVVRFRDGRQQHHPGPAELWMDPREHLTVTREEALQVAAKEAVVVYSRAPELGVVSRRIVHGPMLFVPAPGEWLHTFAWHGAHGGSEGVKKVAKGLVFQKLWLMPDQMYHDVADVRTADDAVLTIRLMIFFELLDIERMLEATHDPIGDFINAATSDVVDFTGRHSFESFKLNTGRLNDLSAYPQLAGRAAQCGYRINKVVYRGYGAPDRLQAMHDQAIEARTRLQLERATEQQSQELEDYKLNAQLARATKRRAEQATEVEAEIELARKRQEAELRQKETVRASARQHRWADAAAEVEARANADARQREHFAELRELGVDLTAYLTQGRADRVIELRGAGGTHVHLDGVEANGRAG